MDMLNYLFNPFATETKIHWASDIALDKVPPPEQELEWYEDTEKRNKVNEIFLLLGILSAGAAILSAVCLTVTLATVLVTASFALAATVLLVAAVYLATMEPSELDPIYRLEKRHEILSASEVPQFSKLNSALQGYILSKDDIQTVLKHEINRMDYHTFIQKHEIHGLRFLDVQNIALLRPSYLAHLSSFLIEGEEDLDAILNSEEAITFNLTLDELHALNKKTEETGEEDGKTSILETMGSYASSAFGVAKSSSRKMIGSGAKIALKVAKTVVPKQLVNVAQCTSASIVLATQGKYKDSARAALGAVTCATIFAAHETMKAENPENYQIAKDSIKFENFNNQVL